MEDANTQARVLGENEPYTQDEIDNFVTSIGKDKPEAPQKGQEIEGYVFLGGNPADPKNWKQAR